MALNADPKKSATTVHVSVITLYGIEKSGVGRLTNAERGEAPRKHATYNMASGESRLHRNRLG
jgi:hypothetical protein